VVICVLSTCRRARWDDSVLLDVELVKAARRPWARLYLKSNPAGCFST
jgi:hypothetical protein